MRNFIIGTDWWTDCDDAVAIRILARAHKDGQIKIKGIGINACMNESVASLDGFLNTEGVESIPIGIDAEATDFGGNPPYQKNLVKYAKRYKTNADAEDAVRLYRRLLAAAAPGELEIIEIGYLQVIAAVLESGADDISARSGAELIKEKVKKIWVMAGKWDEPLGKENNFARNMRSRVAGSKFCAKCPVPVTFLGWEIGADVISGGELDKNDILHGVLKDHGSENGRSSWDPMLVLAAIIGDENTAEYDFVCGMAAVDPVSGFNTFKERTGGRHRYLIKRRENTYYENLINECIKS